MTITLHWWMLPAAVTVLAFATLLLPRDHDQFGIGTAFCLLLAGFVSCVAWGIYFALALLLGTVVMP